MNSHYICKKIFFFENSILFFRLRTSLYRYMYFIKCLKRPIIFLIIAKFFESLKSSQIDSRFLSIIFQHSRKEQSCRFYLICARRCEIPHDCNRHARVYGVPPLSFAKQNWIRIRPPVNHMSKREIRARTYFTWHASS